MNLTAILVIIAMAVIAMFLSPILGNWMGKGPFVFLIPVALVEMVLALLGLKLMGAGRYPPCIKAKCRITNRNIVSSVGASTGITFKCRCGQLYRLEGKRFLLLDPDGKTAPYKMRTGLLGRWIDDRTAEIDPRPSSALDQ